MRYYNVRVESEGFTGLPVYEKLKNKPLELNLYYTKEIAEKSMEISAKNHQFSSLEEIFIKDDIKEPDQFGKYIKDYIREV